MRIWRDHRGKIRLLRARFLSIFLLFAALVIVFSIVFNNSSKTTPHALAWYGAGWGYRTPITLLHGQVSTNDQTNFPVLISTTNVLFKTVANSGHVALSSGNDIIFTAADGSTLLNYEIENYVGTTGEIEAWVKIPTLSHTADTVIYMYYGNASAAANTTANAQGTWDSNYRAVMHLKESGNGTLGEYKDSTSNGNNMQGGAGTLSKTPTQATGEIGKGESYNGGDFTIKTSPVNVPTIQSTSQTFSAWYKVTTNPTVFQNLVVLSNTSSAGNQLHTDAGPNLGMYNWGGGTILTHAAPTQNQWHYIVWTNSGGTNTLYFDGTSQGTSATALQSATPTSFETGSYDTTPSEGLNGLLDEVRISTTPRASDWITTVME